MTCCVCFWTNQRAHAAPEAENCPRVALSENGAIGAWLFSGPCPEISQIPPGVKPGYQPACVGATWRHAVSSTGDFNWADLLNVSPNASAATGIGAWLHLERAFDGWLLVSIDGALRIAVDGRWVHRRDISRPRGRAYVPIPLTLGAGFHSILFAIESRSSRSGIRALLREKLTSKAPTDAVIYLPGAPPNRKLYEALLDLKLGIFANQTATGLDVELSFPSGGPVVDLPIEVELRPTISHKRHLWKVGTYTAASTKHQAFKFHVTPVDELVDSGLSKLIVRLGETSIERSVWLTPEAVATLEHAKRIESTAVPLHSKTTRFDAVHATLQAHLASVAERMLQPSRVALGAAIRALNELTHDLEYGKELFRRPGYADAYIRSPYDGRPTSILTHVPADLELHPTALRPLITVLHGYNSNPRRILDAFLDSEGSGTSARVAGFVIAPAAYGNSFYRGPGESAVLDAIDWALATYPIDDTRISITGVSMGGTGAAEIALRHSERFAAAAPLCGYHSYFVRRDTSNKPLRPWERKLMHRWSPASLAESGRDIPLFVAHGTKDFPLENSRVLTRRYRELGYNLSEDWPDLGHAVWKRTYRGAAMYSWLTQWQKDKQPKEVTLATTSATGAKKFWLELMRLDESEEPGILDGRITSPTELRIHSRGVAEFRIGTSRHLDENATLNVSVDGEVLVLASRTSRHFIKVNGQWQLNTAAPISPDATPTVSGPWSELFGNPFAVVYGTGDPSTAALNQEVARRLVEPRPGVELNVEVLADRDFSPEHSQLTRVIYVGTPNDHRHLASIHAKLPIQIAAARISVGSLQFTEPDVGVAFVYPDPGRRDRLLGVISGNGPEGLWRVFALPALLPDFVVFDHAVDAAAGEPVLGTDASLRAAGFFRPDWSLPSNPLDPLAPKAR